MKNKLISAVILLVIACTCVFGFAACQITQTPYHEHEYETTVIAPTCEAQGYTHYACKGCDDEYDADYVAAKGHNLVDEVCTVCDYVTNVKLFKDAFIKLPSLTGYNYVGWITDKEDDAGYLMNDVADFAEIYDAYYAKMTEEELARFQNDATINASDLSAYTTLMLKQKAVEAVNLEGVKNLTVYENIYYTTGNSTKEMTAKEALYQLDELICRLQAGGAFVYGVEGDSNGNGSNVMDFDNTAFQSVRIVVLRQYLENAGVKLPEYFDAIFTEIGYDAFYASYQAIYETVRLTATYAQNGKTVADMTAEDKASFEKYWGGGYDLSKDVFLNWNWNSGNKFETYFSGRVAAIALQYHLESGMTIENRFIEAKTQNWIYGDLFDKYEYKGVVYYTHALEAEVKGYTYGQLFTADSCWSPYKLVYIDANGDICEETAEGATALTTSTDGVTYKEQAFECCLNCPSIIYVTADGREVFKKYENGAVNYDAEGYVDKYNLPVELTAEELAKVTVKGVVKVYKYFDAMAAWLKPQDYVVNANGWGAKYVELSDSAKKVIDIFEKTTFNGASFDAFDEMMAEYNKISEDEKALIVQTYTNFTDTVEFLEGRKNALEAVNLEGVKDVTVYENIYYTYASNTKVMSAKDALYQLNNLVCRLQAGAEFVYGTENDSNGNGSKVMDFDNTAFPAIRIVVLRQYLENAGVTLPEYFKAIFTEIEYDNFYDAYNSVYQTVKLTATYAKEGKTVADMTEEDKASFEKYWAADYVINALLNWNWNDGNKFETYYSGRVSAIALQYYVESGMAIENRFVAPKTVQWIYGDRMAEYEYKGVKYIAHVYEDEAKALNRTYGSLIKDYWDATPIYIDADGNICTAETEGATMLTTSTPGVTKTDKADWGENCAGLATKQYKTADGQIVYKRYVWRSKDDGGAYIDYDATDFVDEYNRTVDLSEEELAGVTLVYEAGNVKVYKYFEEMVAWLTAQDYIVNANGWGAKPFELSESANKVIEIFQSADLSGASFDAYNEMMTEYNKTTEKEKAYIAKICTNFDDVVEFLEGRKNVLEAVDLEGVKAVTVYENVYYTYASNTKEMSAKDALYQLNNLICRLQAGAKFGYRTENDSDGNGSKVMDFDNTAFPAIRIVVLRQYLENAGVTLPEYFGAIFTEIGYDAFYASYQAIYETVRLTATYAKDGKTIDDMTTEDKASFEKYWGGGYDISKDAFLNWNWNSGNKFETYFSARVAAIALQYYVVSGQTMEARFGSPKTVQWKYGDRMAEYEYKGVKYIAHVYQDEAEALNRTYGSLMVGYWNDDANPIYIDADGNICSSDTEGATMLTTSTPGVTKTDKADWGENCAGLATNQYKTADGQFVYKRYVWSASGSYIDYDAPDFVDEYNRTVDLSAEELAEVALVYEVKVYKFYDEMAAWLTAQGYTVNANGWGYTQAA